MLAARESTLLPTERTTIALLFKARENERKGKPQKTSTRMKKEGARKTGRQMDTLDPVKSRRRRQTFGDVRMFEGIFLLKGWQAKSMVSGHNPVHTDGLTRKGTWLCCVRCAFECLLPTRCGPGGTSV